MTTKRSCDLTPTMLVTLLMLLLTPPCCGQRTSLATDGAGDDPGNDAGHPGLDALILTLRHQSSIELGRP